MTEGQDRSFFGHPRGLAYLAFTEVWEGFSYYGMQALLMLYMVGELLRPGHFDHVAGLGRLRAAMEAVGGPLSTIGLASQIFSLYVAAVNLTPLLGGWLGDRRLGQTRTIVLGAVMMAAGHLSLTFEASFLLGLTLLVFGAGFIKGNLAVQIGNLYPPGDPRRARGFGVYMLVRNIGSLSAPLVCGTLGELYGWRYGFGVAALAMLAALAIYLAGRRTLPAERRVAGGATDSAPLDRDDRRAVAGLLLALIPYLLMFSAVYQAYTILPVWAVDHVDRTVGGRTIPVTWIYTFDGLATIAGIAVAVRLWGRLSAQGREPDALAKMSIGCAMTAIAYAWLAAAAALAPGRVPLFALLAFFLLLDFSFVWGEPPLRALVSERAPPSRATILMSLAIMSIALANIVVGGLARLYERLGIAPFWLLHGAIAAAGLAAAILLRPTIVKLTEGRGG